MYHTYFFLGFLATDDFEVALKMKADTETAISEMDGFATSDPVKDEQLPPKRHRKRRDSLYNDDDEENDGIKKIFLLQPAFM